MALLTFTDQITRALDEGKIVIGIYLDFSKAFDTVNHDILNTKLEHYGIRGVVLQWFSNYLNNREQCVVYNGTTSKSMRIKCGVPQGSILGLILFLLYINDIPAAAQSTSLILFADDSNFFLRGKKV